jgi:transcriptional regulator
VYVPTAFEVGDPEQVASLIAGIGVGHLVTHHDDGLQASFIPMLFDADRGVVRGHLARANPHHRAIGDGAPALVIVTGADGYVSPSWYATKQVNAKVVPTWNYELVHVHGTARVVDDAQLEGIVRALTDRHEATMAEPWSVDDAPRDYIDAMLRAIVGVEVTVERIEAKRKLSQNRSSEDISGVIAGLNGSVAARSLADVMAAAADQTVIE